MERMQFKRIGSKVYGVCHGCGKIVRLNKALLADVHFCLTLEDQRLHRRQITKAVDAAQEMLAHW